jgi:hypothetical protein
MSKLMLASADVTDSVQVLREFAVEADDRALIDAWNQLALQMGEKCVNIVFNPGPGLGRLGASR